MKSAKFFIVGLVLLAGVALFGGMNMSAAYASGKNTDKAIVVVSFGTTYPEARKACIESVETAIKDAFPDYEVRRAFTSKIVMKKLAERDNIHVNDLETALTKLKNEGYKNIVVQTTHLTPGEEYDKKVIAVVDKFRAAGAFEKLVVGRPLLYYKGENNNPDDFAILAEALKNQMPLLNIAGRSVLFMGHGSPHQPNPAYQTLQDNFNQKNTNAVIGVVEETDHPNFEDALQLLRQRNVKAVTLMPLMLVAGDHANNDMSGDEPDSWKSILANEGFEVKTYVHGLGENQAVQDIYVQHVRDAILTM